METDLVVVGGGIAGCALAATLASEGVDVVVIERRSAYDDIVRGEGLWPWGVAEARRLGLLDVLVHASGGSYVTSLIDYADGDAPDEAEENAVPLGELIDGAPGALNVAHPVACTALAAEAARRGATVLRGAVHMHVQPGTAPVVRFEVDGDVREATCRLVVGADGRASAVRHQAGIALEHSAETHMIAGLLVDGLGVDASRDIAANGEDLFMVTFPQTAGRARVYLFAGRDQPQRFAGRHGIERFIAESAVAGLPDSHAWTEAVPAGPCRTFPGDDTWTERPFAEGVVLIGDAGGYNNPLIGEGLALALRDVRALCDVLIDDGVRDTADPAFAHYGLERAERLRRMRFIAQLQAVELTTFGEEGRALRRGIRRRLAEDESLLPGVLAMFTGPDDLDPEVCTPEFRRRYLGL